MKESAIMPALMAGKPLLVVEYRSSNPEVITYRDKQTGRSANFKALTHTVELGTASVMVRERVGDDFDPATYKAPFKKGTRCILHLEGFGRESGVYKAAGVLEPLEA